MKNKNPEQIEILLKEIHTKIPVSQIPGEGRPLIDNANSQLVEIKRTFGKTNSTLIQPHNINFLY